MKNFIVTAPTRGLATLFAEAAERHRKEKAILWLGRELPPWRKPCPLVVRVTMSGAAGATTFEFAEEPITGQLLAGATSDRGTAGGFIFRQGKVKSRRMQLEGSIDRLLLSALPHEVTHAVFADYFGKPIVRWADEGGAVLSEDEDAQQRHQQLTRHIIDMPARAIPLRRLVARTDFPDDPMVLYAQGYSVARFLVAKKDRKTFLAFVKQGMDEGWNPAVKGHYGYRDVEALEDDWLADLRKQGQAKPAPGPRASIQVGQDATGVRSVPPALGLAVVEKQGRVLRLCEFGCVYAPTDAGAGQNSEDRGPGYVPVAQLVERTLDLAQTPVYTMDGKRVESKRLAELLPEQTPVVIARDGKMVDPFHLRVIKEGTLIVVPPPGPVVPERQPPAIRP
jgi:hypothetical protein